MADVAATIVEKVRINPGNYVDPARTFKQLEYTDQEYAQEIQRIRDRFIPFLSICREHNTAIRIGVNHGSLSDRIMSRYGNTPAGIVVLDARITVSLVTLGHTYGKTPGRDYCLLTYDFLPELCKYDGIGMLRQQNEKLYLESQRWLLDGYAEKRLPFHSAIPAELITAAPEETVSETPALC